MNCAYGHVTGSRESFFPARGIVIPFQGCTADGAIADAIGIEELLQGLPLAGIAFGDHVGFVFTHSVPIGLIKEFFKLSQQFAGVGRSDLDRTHGCGEVVCDAVFQGKRIAVVQLGSQPTLAMPGLLIGHADGAVIRGIGIAVRRIEQVEYLFGEVEPAVGIEILRVILSDAGLKLPLPGRDHFMKGLGGGSKVIRIVDQLFVVIAMDLRHPLIVFLHAGLCFHLCLPGPVAVQIKVIMVHPSAGPGLPVFAGREIGYRFFAGHLVVPVHVAVAAIRVEAGINENNGILQPGFCLRIRGIE